MEQGGRWTENQGKRAAKKSKQWLRRHKLNDLAPRIESIVAKRLDNGFSSSKLRPALQDVRQKWNRTVREASMRPDSALFHEVRIKTKDLRDMIELVSQLMNIDQSKELIEWLKSVQDELGEWRDQTELCRRLTAVLSQDAALQSDSVATAMIDTARSRTQYHDEHARRVIGSLRKTEARKQIAAVENGAQH
jgi:CHAD domain-containing protein